MGKTWARFHLLGASHLPVLKSSSPHPASPNSPNWFSSVSEYACGRPWRRSLKRFERPKNVRNGEF